VWELEHDGARWDWDEATVQFNNAPGVAFDGNSRTLGIDPRYAADASDCPNKFRISGGLDAAPQFSPDELFRLKALLQSI